MDYVSRETCSKIQKKFVYAHKEIRNELDEKIFFFSVKACLC